MTKVNQENVVGMIKMTISLSGQPRLFALVEGGWLFPWATSPAFILDSNAVSYLLKPEGMISEEQVWLDGILNHNDTTINLTLKALEGNSGMTFPSFDQFKDVLTEDTRKLSEKYPSLKIINYDNSDLTSVYDLVNASSAYGANEINFLTEVAPLIRHHSSAKDFNEKESTLFDQARNFGLRFDSTSLYLALSCLYSPTGSEDIARKVLKPSKSLTSGFYNGFADINFLRMFTASLCFANFHNSQRFALLTADRPFVALWCGMNLRNFRYDSSGRATADYDFSEKLFPSLNESERIKLVERVKVI